MVRIPLPVLFIVKANNEIGCHQARSSSLISSVPPNHGCIAPRGSARLGPRTRGHGRGARLRLGALGQGHRNGKHRWLLVSGWQDPGAGSKSRALFVRQVDEDRWFEPALGRSLAALSERQRVAVVLVHGYGWTSREVAEMTGIKATTVQSHLERGLARLRSQLEVERSEHD